MDFPIEPKEKKKKKTQPASILILASSDPYLPDRTIR